MSRIEHLGEIVTIENGVVSCEDKGLEGFVASLLPKVGSEWPDPDHYRALQVVELIGGEMLSKAEASTGDEIF